MLTDDDDLQELPLPEERRRVRVEQKYNAGDDYTSLIPYKGGHLAHQTRFPILTGKECDAIIQEAEDTWAADRDGIFLTVQMPLVELPQAFKFMQLALLERIYPLLRTQFGCYLPDPSNLRVMECFVLKYDAARGQTELKPHRDPKDLSFNIALNPSSDFTGGGTWFHSLNDAIKIEQGHVLTYAAAQLHGGQEITFGKRYILVAFVAVEGNARWSLKFFSEQLKSM